MDTENQNQPVAAAPRKWRPIPALQRRVLGVLMEKAKTTPEQYPMTLNGICTGCNQKSNRCPQMDVEPEDAEQALDQLKSVGAVAEIQGSGRVNKYRHFFYEWLGVDKVESAVMAELLLRGAQTEGELRTRASRMEAIADLAALRQILDGLKAKGLVISLTPAGRGHVITHGLHEPRELERVRSELGSFSSADLSAERQPPDRNEPAQNTSRPTLTPALSQREREKDAPMNRPGEVAHPAADGLRNELSGVRAELAQLRGDFDELSSELRRALDELRQLKDSLGG